LVVAGFLGGQAASSPDWLVAAVAVSVLLGLGGWVLGVLLIGTRGVLFITDAWRKRVEKGRRVEERMFLEERANED
jgi:hypothetical protein